MNGDGKQRNFLVELLRWDWKMERQGEEKSFLYKSFFFLEEQINIEEWEKEDERLQNREEIWEKHFFLEQRERDQKRKKKRKRLKKLFLYGWPIMFFNTIK